MTEESCIFCKIVRKEAPASCIYEDGRTMAFLDIRPLNEGHTLVIPKKHYDYIYNVPEQDIAHLFTVVKKVACAVKKGIGAEGISITQHNESAAGQDIFHVHVHVIPRYKGQKLPRFEEIQQKEREKLDAVAKKLRQYL